MRHHSLQRSLLLVAAILFTTGCGKSQNYEQPAPDADEAPAFNSPAADGPSFPENSASEKTTGVSVKIPGVVDLKVDGGKVDLKTPVADVKTDGTGGADVEALGVEVKSE